MFFFLLPWGHDQPVYERPWLTYTLVGLCTLVFLLTWSMESRATEQLDTAVVEIDDVLATHPDARVHLTISGLPARIDEILTPLVTSDATRPAKAGDDQLELAVRHLIAALNRMPAFAYGFQPGAPRAGRVVSHMFVHGGLGHLLGNMLFLWLAGGVLECFWRRWAYLALYFASGLAGLAAHFLSAPHSLVPVVGASGAIAGLLGAFVVGYPRTRIKVVWFGLLLLQPLWGNWKIPAWVLIPLWAIIEVANAYLGGEDSGVAHWAHVGGFACGAVVALVARRANLVATDAGHEIAPRDRPVETATRPAGTPSRAPAPMSEPALPSRPSSAVSAPVPSTPPPPRRSQRPLEIDASELPPPSDDDEIVR